MLCLCAWLLPVQAEEIQGTNLPLDILQMDTGGEVGATARLEFSLKDTFRESYLEYCLAVSKQGEKDILTYDNHDKNDTVELTLQRGLCYSLYVLISDGQGSRAFSGVLRPMEDGTLMIGGEEILYEPEEEKPRTRSAGLMPVVYESEPNSNYGNADIIRPDECMKGYLATFYDTDCFKIEASNLSDARGYTVQLAVPPGVDYDIRIYDQSKVISYYDDVAATFTNFAMSGIDKRYYGLEVGVVVPIWGGISFNGALSLGDYRYTSDANFTQTRDNSEEVLRGDKVLWDDLYVESTPQTALNLGLSYRGPRNWFASVDFNYYDRIYLSMNPARRTRAAYATVLRPDEAAQLPGAVKYTALMNLREQEKFDSAYTLNLSVGKNWYIHRIYQLGFSLEVKNILNDQTIRTGGYEQMRLSRRTYVNKEGAAAQPIQYYVPFDSKYFYLLGTTYYLNVYFRF